MVLLIAATACRTPPNVGRSDVVAYLHQLRDWAPQEAESARTVRRLLQSQFVDEADVRHQIADDRPRAAAQLRRAQAYEPRTADVASIHDAYRHAWAELVAGYEQILRGLDTGDQGALASGRNDLLEWRRGIATVASRIGRLADRYDARSEAGPPASGR